ncbi:zinc finger protein 395b [Esox lucius]|nr:zinc finger protein 395b [Esox lucius]XP_034143685.1 zinc finger protein 395b [Esox lucius]
MAAMGPGGKGQESLPPPAPLTCPSREGPRPGEPRPEGLVHMQCRGKEVPAETERKSHKDVKETNLEGLVFVPHGRAEVGWTHVSSPQQTTSPTMPSCQGSTPCSFRSPGSVDMDEIMAAMVLTSLSCTSVVHDSPHSYIDPVPASSSGGGDMECGGGELSDSGSSGYWSWDHGNVSPAPSPSVAEMDSSPDEGLHMELEQGEELNHAKRSKSGFRGGYRCLWPGCGKVLTSSVGMRKHVRLLHLGSGSEHSQREEDFYYTKISCEVPSADHPVSSIPPAPPAPVLTSSPPGAGLQIPSTSSGSSRPGPDPVQPSALSQSAPSSFWQIQTEHLYPACTPIRGGVASCSPALCQWTPPPLTATRPHSHTNTQVATVRCRSVSVGEQWLQQNSATSRLTTMTAASPSRSHCSFSRKARGEAKKCRKVYGLEHKDQWCTSCRWKKACQRFPD